MTGNRYPEGTLAHDVEHLRRAVWQAIEQIGRAVTEAADRALGGPVTIEALTRSVVDDGPTYAERAWLMAPATPWTLDLIRSAWTDDEACQAARKALADDVDVDLVADALIAYLDERDRRAAAAIEALVVPRRCGADLVVGCEWVCDASRCDLPDVCPLVEPNGLAPAPRPGR